MLTGTDISSCMQDRILIFLAYGPIKKTCKYIKYINIVNIIL